MKVIEVSFILLILGFVLIVPGSTATDCEWSHYNYLYSLKIISYDDPVTAGQSGSITVEVGADTDVVLYTEFKGEFDWGHWTFSSEETPLGPGPEKVTSKVYVPHKTMIEPSSNFYFYVYVTLPEEVWDPSVWGLTQMVAISPPQEVCHEELVVFMSHLKWLVHTSKLSDGIKNSLFSKLEAAGNEIDSAYSSGNMNKLNGAIGSMNSFINEVDSDSEAATYPDSGLWQQQAGYIIERMETAIS